MAEIPVQIIDSIKLFAKNLKSELSIKKIFIFGSYAKGSFNQNSDIDVCIIADNVENNYLSMLTAIQKTAGIDYRIEPVVYSIDEFNEAISFGLLKEIKNTGIEIQY